MGTQKEVANLVLFPGSDEALFVPGGVVTVDRGFSTGKRFGIDEIYGLYYAV